MRGRTARWLDRAGEGGGVVVCVSPNQAPGRKDPLGCTSSISSALPGRVLAACLSQYLHHRGLCWGDGSSELAASPHPYHPPPTLSACVCVYVWVIEMLRDGECVCSLRLGVRAIWPPWWWKTLLASCVITAHSPALNCHYRVIRRLMCSTRRSCVCVCVCNPEANSRCCAAAG